MKRKGFTLVELISVIAILAILGGILVPRIAGYQAKAKKSRFQHSARNIIHIVQAYNSDKSERLSGGVVNNRKVKDTDVISDIFTYAINSEINQSMVDMTSETYLGLKDLTLAQLVGVANSNFKLNSDGTIDISSIITGSIDD
ncbi:type II secretion system protein [Clostridium thermarum]|uniref:type II secretion system protein n=1 Tax=Clostridium thermarum TaxID=1716543 RepID=UPI0013D7444D|nr:type II secretion system protein [Clostridium thermarum]